MSLLANSNAIETGGYQISRSVRLRKSASAYFSRTPGSSGNRKTWTLSAWAKICSSSNNDILSVYNSGTDFCRLYFDLWSANQIALYWYNGSLAATVASANLLRDPSAWYHLMWVVDTTQSTASNRVKLYVNGVQITTFSTAGALNYPSQNSDLPINNNVAHNIGAFSGTGNFDGYLTEINFIDGQALTPSSFGETDPITGSWVAKKYTGSYGTNGFFLTFADNSAATSTTIGKDYSGNGNNWTPNNINVSAYTGTPPNNTSYDSMLDVPSGSGYADGGNGRGNYATLNPLDTATSSTLTNGNLTNTLSTGSGSSQASTVAMTSGKWYWEVSESSVTNQSCGVGILRANLPATVTRDSNPGGVYYVSGGSKFIDGTNTSYGTAWGSTGVTYVIGVALDLDAGTVTFYLNNTSQGAITLPSNTYGWRSHAIWSSASGTGTFETNFGQRPFSYTPPTGFKALNTTNLSDPTVKNGAGYFAATLYTGNGTSQSISNAVNGTSFQPDFVWIKNRSGAISHSLYDSVRGAGWRLASNETTAQLNYTSQMTAFNSNGFSVATTNNEVNESPTSYVGWQWKANGTGVSNTAGTITSTVSANTTSGFSVVTYTGNNTSGATVGHGLGVKPAFIVVKKRTGIDGWGIYHTSLGATKTMELNTTAAETTSVIPWNNTEPTSSVIYLNGNNYANSSSYTYIMYCFAAVPGYSAFGSYSGSADLPFVYCGFRPRWVLIKATTGSNNWIIYDTVRNTYNLTNLSLVPDSSALENGISSTIENTLDILSNGFKLRTSNALTNGSSVPYIYAAFAENPLKFSNAR